MLDHKKDGNLEFVLWHVGIKPEVNYKKITRKLPAIWKLNNILLSNLVIKEEITVNYFELNDENVT